MTVSIEALVAGQAVIARLDASAPGLVTELFLIGSAILDDWQTGQSDVDVLGILARNPTEPERRCLEAALRSEGPKIEAEWFTRAELAIPQSTAVRAVALRTLVQGGLSLRGVVPSQISDNSTLLAELLVANLQTYWFDWIGRARQPFSRFGLSMLGDWAPAWGVLGVARIIYTLRTGDIISKSGAGRWALSQFPEHARILTECIRLRTGDGPKSYVEPLRRKRDALAAMNAMILASRP